MKRIGSFIMIALLLASTLGFLAPASTAAQTGDACADALNGIAPAGYTIVSGSGGSGNQVVLGTDGDDFLSGGSGDDILCGFGGDDVLDAGSGNDVLVGGPGADQLYGGSRNDTLYGDTDDPVLDGGSGSNQVITVAAPPPPLDPPSLTVVWTLESSGATFNGDVTGSGLQPGATVVADVLYLDGFRSTLDYGLVNSDGTYSLFIGGASCNYLTSITFSSTDRDGNPIATDGSVPC